jgi:hypothetical protein
MRITLHAVVADEYTTYHEAMLPVLRASRLNDRRFTSTGLTSDDADAAEERVATFATQPKSKDEINEMLSEADGSPVEPRLWWALRSYAALIHAPTGPPWSFGRNQVFETAPDVPPRTSPEEALQRLVRRYLEGFGPASAQDLAQFTLQRQSEVAPALEALGDRLRTIEGPDGGILLDVPGGELPSEDTPAPPRLLGMWDSILLAYRDRSRVIPEEYRAHVIRRNGDVLPTVLVDGYVAGVWRPVDDGIEVRAFRTLTDRDWDGIGSEAEGLASLIAARDPSTYRRYANWWSEIPEGVIRTLP